jgi:hypothetical protein
MSGFSGPKKKVQQSAPDGVNFCDNRFAKPPIGAPCCQIPVNTFSASAERSQVQIVKI